MQDNFIYRTNRINFNKFIAWSSNKQINQWIILNEKTIYNKVRNIKVIKDNRIKGKAFLESPKI